VQTIVSIQFLSAIAAIGVLLYHHVNEARDSYAPRFPGFAVGALVVVQSIFALIVRRLVHVIVETPLTGAAQRLLTSSRRPPAIPLHPRPT
jgi:hypothetical protein